MKEILAHLDELKATFDKALEELAEAADLEALRVRYLGKKGEITQVMKHMGKLSKEERPVLGQAANVVRQHVEERLEAAKADMEAKQQRARFAAEAIDVTLPGTRPAQGLAHPITQVIDEITDVYFGLGFDIIEGPEVEWVKYNFSMLRLDENHPARAETDTFYITDDICIRTQTSPVQIRAMQEIEPPLRVVVPGRCYRSDTPDATHTPVFHQIEGLVIDKGIAMSDLVGHLKLFAKALFGEDTDIRLRPHHFPFTEPSCEVDLTCWACHGKHDDCPTCKGEGWIEVLGAGMVHPEVIENCGIDSSVYSGFAFGIGVERTAMGRYLIDDIRRFYENDMRFLRQFHE